MADIRLESFPFDSDPDGYDAYGYPVFDRAVSARTYRYSLEQFFTDGVFGTPANALQISKGTGLNVVIQPGIGIIRGGIGGVFDDPATLELDTAAPQGNVAYAIMLRCDDNDDKRSLYLHVEKGTADANPIPPEPTVTDIIKDLRLGYVVVPSGATDLSSATVTNEKGQTVCPYAAPFEEIDVDGIVSDFRVSANEALSALLNYFDNYRGVVDSALDDTEAGYLQQQITAIQEQLANTDLSGSVDDETIEYDTAAGEISPKLRVKDGGIGEGQIAGDSITTAAIKNSQITHAKLDPLLQVELGILDYSTVTDADTFMALYNGSDSTGKQAVVTNSLFNLSWSDIAEVVYQVDVSYLSTIVGKTKNVTTTAYGSVPFMVIGINHDALAAGGGNARLTLQSVNVLFESAMTSAVSDANNWSNSIVRSTLNSTFFNGIIDPSADDVKEVTKTYQYNGQSGAVATGTTNDHVFVPGGGEVGEDAHSSQDGTAYDYYSGGATAKRVKKYNGEDCIWWLTRKDRTSILDWYAINDSGYMMDYNPTTSRGVAPCFCV